MIKKSRQRMTRIVCLIISLATVVCCMSSVALADEYESSFINVLDYNDGGTFTVNGSLSLSFDLPFYTSLHYLDSLVVFSGDSLSSVSVSYGNVTTSLNFSRISPGMGFYKIYGSLPGSGSSSLSLNFVSSGVSYVSFDSLRVLTVPSTNFSLSSDGSVVNNYLNKSFPLTYSSSGSGTDYTGLFPAAVTNREWEATLYPSGYQNFDSVSYMIYLDGVELTSVSAVYDGVSLPVTYNLAMNDTAPDSGMIVSVLVDFSGCAWDSSSQPHLVLTGSFNNDTIFHFSIFECSGILSLRNSNPVLFYLRNLYHSMSSWIQDQTSSLSYWLEEILNELRGESSDTSAGDTLVNQGQQIQDFEHEHQVVINQGTEVMTNTLNISGFAPALLFVSSTLDGVFDILGPYQVVFIIPVVIGMILFVCSKVPGNIRPGRSSPGPKRVQRDIKED